jgi:hypothetical protein
LQEQASGRLSLLPPPPDALEKKVKKKGSTADMPRSLQRMLQMKVIIDTVQDLSAAVMLNITPRAVICTSQALAERKQKQEPQTPNSTTNRIQLDKQNITRAEPSAEQANSQAGTSAGQGLGRGAMAERSTAGVQSSMQAGPALSQEGADGLSVDLPSPSHEQRGGNTASISRQDAPAAQPGPQGTKRRDAAWGGQPPGSVKAAAAGKSLKASKKEFLKRKKLKKRRHSHLPDEDDLEARLLQDPHKPKFGEQAMAPIKVGDLWP